MLEEPTHSSYFKAKIPEETVVLEQTETFSWSTGELEGWTDYRQKQNPLQHHVEK